MEKQQEYIGSARKAIMSNRKVVCTGNPERPGTLASGFKKLFPDAVFLCRSTGWDLTDLKNNEEKLIDVFKKCNTFLNCSYIGPMVQSELLAICQKTVKFCDVVNIGSTHEYDGYGTKSYQLSKLDLREHSLKFNTFRLSTCHFMLGGIKNDASPEKEDWLDIDLICQTIVSQWDLPYRVTMTVMDQNKQPW